MKEYVVKARLSRQEYEHLLRKIEEDSSVELRGGRKNISDYIRKKIRTAESSKDLKKEIRDLIFQIRKIGVNVNQIAKKINAGYVEKDAEKLLLQELKNVEHCFYTLMEKLEHGDNKIT